MKLLTVATFLVLLVGTEAFLPFIGAIVGITAGVFFNSAEKAVRQVSNTVREVSNTVDTNLAAIRSMLETKIVPDLQEKLNIVGKSTEELVNVIKSLKASIVESLNKMGDVIGDIGKKVNHAAEEIVNMTKRLETRVEESLNKLDDVIGNIGKNVNHAVDIIIVTACVLLYKLCSYCRSSARNGYLFYQYLTFLMIISLITATGVLLRVFCSSVLQYEHERAATIMLCVGLPIAWNLLRLVHYFFTSVRPVVYFLILGPRLIVLVTLDAPFRWVFRAYKLAKEERSPTYVLITISLPWLALIFGIMAYRRFDDDSSAFWMGLLTSYLYFYFNAVCLYFCYQPLSPRERLRELPDGASTTEPQLDSLRRQYQQIPYRI